LSERTLLSFGKNNNKENCPMLLLIAAKNKLIFVMLLYANAKLRCIVQGSVRKPIGPNTKRCAQRLSIHLHLRLPGFTTKPIYDGTLGANFATDSEAFQYLLSMSLHQTPHHPLEFLYFMFHL
jgi:hypothetical protein